MADSISIDTGHESWCDLRGEIIFGGPRCTCQCELRARIAQLETALMGCNAERIQFKFENQRLRADGERDRERLVNAIFANVDRETYAMIMRDENEVQPRSVDSARGN